VNENECFRLSVGKEKAHSEWARLRIAIDHDKKEKKMQISISGHQLDVTEALKSYVTEKVDRIERHAEHITKVEITLTVEKSRQKAEGNVHVAGADVHASAEHDDMYAAIDAMADKLDRQLVKHREKTISRMHGH
jgi:putative sigma-54 modulation protein